MIGYKISHADNAGALAAKFTLWGTAAAEADDALVVDRSSGNNIPSSSIDGAGNGTVNFADGQTSITFIVTDIAESNGKTVVPTLSSAPQVQMGSGCCTWAVPAYNFGSPSSATITMIDPPIGVRGVALNAVERTRFNGVTAVITDPDTGAPASDYSATIDWGDGTTGTAAFNSNGNGAFVVTGGHTYQEEGTYTVQTTVQDVAGGPTQSGNATATVADAPPQVNLNNIQAFVGVAGTFDLGTILDPVGLELLNATLVDLSDYLVTIDWGDGSGPIQVTPVATGPNSVEIYGTHAYLTPGPVHVTVSTTDGSGEGSGGAGGGGSGGGGGTTTTVSGGGTATLAPLQASTVPIAATEGQPFTGTVAKFIDPSGTQWGSYTATITWPDGSTSSVTPTPDGSTPNGFNVPGSFTFAEEGTPTVAVSISDANGRSVNVTSNATVADPPLQGSGVAPLTESADTTFTAVVATFHDPDPRGSAGDYTAQIDWGDNQTSPGTIQVDPNDPTLFDVVGSFDYTSAAINAYLAATGSSYTGSFSGNVKIVHAALAALPLFFQLGIPVQISKVEWVAHPESPLDPNPGPGGGSRIYPDQNSTSRASVDAIDRSLVDFRATISPALQGVPVYLEVVDVDDPSANATPVPGMPALTDTAGIVDNESLSADNRGDGLRGTGYSSPQFYPAGRTSPAGLVTALNFKVSMQPGDNYRAVASLRPIAAGDYTAIQDDGTSAGITDHTVTPAVRLGMGPAPAAMSDILTVWRHLHVETDSMGVVVGNQVSGTMTIAGVSPATATIQTDQSLDAGEAGRFGDGSETTQGWLKDGLGTRYPVISHTTGDNFMILVGLTDPSTGAPLPPPAAGIFTLVDDDTYLTGAQLGMPITSTLAPALAAAYVTPVYNDVGVSDGSVPFVLNVENGQAAAAIGPFWQSRGLNATNFWVAYLLEAFQGPMAQDGDPDSEWLIPSPGVIEGVTSGNDGRAYGGSLIYKEVNAEDARRSTPPLPLSTVEGDTVVHEIGHAVANSGVEPVTTWPIAHSVYTRIYINLIRSSLKPGS